MRFFDTQTSQSYTTAHKQAQTALVFQNKYLEFTIFSKKTSVNLSFAGVNGLKVVRYNNTPGYDPPNTYLPGSCENPT